MMVKSLVPIVFSPVYASQAPVLCRSQHCIQLHLSLGHLLLGNSLRPLHLRHLIHTFFAALPFCPPHKALCTPSRPLEDSLLSEIALKDAQSAFVVRPSQKACSAFYAALKLHASRGGGDRIKNRILLSSNDGEGRRRPPPVLARAWHRSCPSLWAVCLASERPHLEWPCHLQEKYDLQNGQLCWIPTFQYVLCIS